MTLEIKEIFANLLNQDEDQLNLAQAALLMADYIAGGVDLTHYLQQIDAMSEAIRPAVQEAESGEDALAILDNYFFNELAFKGNSEAYYQPSNSFLHRVVDSKKGIPITLSVIYLHIGWSLNLPLSGIGLPGHFLVGYDLPHIPQFIDVFNGGKRLTIEDCLELCQLPLSDLAPFTKEYLQPATKKAILFRMLLNLKHIYIKHKDWENGYKVVDLMLVIRPDAASEFRDRGLMASRLDRLQDAVYDIRQYLILAPDRSDASWLQRYLEQLETKLYRLN